MQFCPECNFMVYTKLSNQVEEETEGSKGDLTLINYCKNCGWKGVLENTETAIYRRNYENDFIADRILNNKYTIYDNALPRLNIGCTNDGCITNLSIDSDNSFIIDNLPETIEDSDISDFLKGDIDNNNISNYKRLRLTSVAVICKNSDVRDELLSKYAEQNIDGNDLNTRNYTKPDNEVLYIKYDPENMKYLYMCVNCGSSWQGNY